MSASDHIAIVATVIAFVSLMWGIYSHLSTRKIARVFFEVSQISDTLVPKEFLKELTMAPVSVEVLSTGTKSAENVCLEMHTRSKIKRFEADPQDIGTLPQEDVFLAVIPRMNPSQRYKVLLYCDGPPWQDQMATLSCTHSEGIAQDKRTSQVSMIEFSLLGMELIYDVATGTIGGARLGPLRFGKRS